MFKQKYDEVVISGVGGYFPKCINIEDFKEKILNNENFLDSRWRDGERGATNVIGTIPIANLDSSFFGIHFEQCQFMDPMHRISFERTYEAIVDAGVNPVDLKGRRVAVFAAITVGENDNWYCAVGTGHGLVGHSRSMLPNRLSYNLNLKGPSIAYDCNWLGGIQVLEAALEVVGSGQCESAVVVTANIALNSEMQWYFNAMGLLSPDGLTRAFDATANGYGRCDGVIAFFIQRACDAKRSYATVLGTKFMYDGDVNGGFRNNVNLNAMTNFIEKFYDDCKVDPNDVEFVECYGCGLKTYDEVEMEAISRVYCKTRKDPLLVGSVKSNTGHAETSSVFMSLAKLLVAFETGTIPANYHFNTVNPNINSLADGRIQIVDKNKECDLKLAAINAVGISSSYGHILLKANLKKKIRKPDNLPRLINISTRTEEGISSIVSMLRSQAELDLEQISLIQDTFKKSIPGHTYRGFTTIGHEECRTKSEYFPDKKRKTWFVYSGMGSQWCKMATDLMILPLFAEAIQKCHRVLEPKGIDLIHIVTGDDKNMFDNILHSFVGIAAIQIGLTDVLHAIDIVPDGIIGHSVGELGCAYADGCLSAEQMILCAYYRGKASLEADLIKGMMAAVGMGYQQIKDTLPDSIEVACHNALDSSTISGPAEEMQEFVKTLEEKQIFARLVNVANIAYHSKYIKPAGPLLLKYLQEVIPHPLPRSSKWISTSIPEEQWDTNLAKTSSAEYHTNNLLSAVLFEEGSKCIPEDAVLIEIAPHGLLQAILKRSLKNTINIPLTNKHSNNGLMFFLEALGKMYLAGLCMNLKELYPKINYPVGKGTKSLAPLVQWDHKEAWSTYSERKVRYSATSNVKELKVSADTKEFGELIGHDLQSNLVIPTSAYLGILCGMLCDVKLISPENVSLVFENLTFKKIIAVPRKGGINVTFTVQKGSGSFEITLENELIATGRVKHVNEISFAHLSANQQSEEMDENYNIVVNSKSFLLSGNEVYKEFYHRKHNYDGNYKLIKNLELLKKGSVSTVAWNSKWENLIEAMIQQSLFYRGECDQSTLVVTSIREICIAMPELQSKSSDLLEVVYNYASEIIATKGIQISGITTKPLEIIGLNKYMVSYNTIKEILMSDTNILQNIENVISICLKISLDNFENGTIRKAMIVEVESENSSLRSIIEEAVNNNCNFEVVTSTSKDFKSIMPLQDRPLCVILDSFVNKECIDFVIATNVLLLTRTNVNIFCNSEITEIANFTVNDIQYSLVRKDLHMKPIVMPIKVDSLCAEDFSSGKIPWITKLKAAAMTEKTKRVFLVFKVIPFDGIYGFVKKVQSLPDMQNIRFVFALNKSGLEFSISEPAYQTIIKNDLVLSVIKDGSITTYVIEPTEFEARRLRVSEKDSYIIGDTVIEYIGINVRDETLLLHNNINPELGCVDYSGITASGEKVMGLAQLDTKLCRLVPDPILKWKVPNIWSLEDAATLPYAHTMAYYALRILARTTPNESVLVHNGCTSYGLAAIFLASQIGCTVYTTVTSDTQKAFIKKHSAFMDDANIFNGRNTSFEAQVLLATGGKGVHVILNCVSGSMLDATIRCMADLGRFIHFGELDLEENKQIGMRVFAKNANFSTFSIKTVFTASSELKRKVWSYVSNGLENYVVRPLWREITNLQDITSILRRAKQPDRIGKIVVKVTNNLKLNELNIFNTTQFICNADNAYLVYGGNAEMWADMLEWLIFRGAKKLVVSSKSQPEEIYIHRRLKLYQTYYNVQIIFSRSRDFEKQSISQLLSEVYKVGPIGAVFILPILESNPEEVIKTVQNINYALKTTAPKAPLINFVNSTFGICQLRNNAGLSGYNIQWDDTLDFLDAVHALDSILRCDIKENFLTKDVSDINFQETPQSLYDKLELLFSNFLKNIQNEVLHVPKKPDFIKLPSLSLPNMKEVPPFFIIPGMFNRSAAQNLARNVLYPVYCASFPTTPLPLKDIVTSLAEKMKELLPKGPYNIIGISHGGLLATEITKVLEKDNYKTTLQLLDGAADTIQGILKYLGTGKLSELRFLYYILNIKDIEIINRANKLSNWEERLDLALTYYSYLTEHETLKEPMTTFKKYLDQISSFQPTEELISGEISLFRPVGSSINDYCGLSKYCQQEPQVYLIKGDFRSLLDAKETARIMCMNVIDL